MEWQHWMPYKTPTLQQGSPSIMEQGESIMTQGNCLVTMQGRDAGEPLDHAARKSWLLMWGIHEIHLLIVESVLNCIWVVLQLLHDASEHPWWEENAKQCTTDASVAYQLLSNLWSTRYPITCYLSTMHLYQFHGERLGSRCVCSMYMLQITQHVLEGSSRRKPPLGQWCGGDTSVGQTWQLQMASTDGHNWHIIGTHILTVS